MSEKIDAYKATFTDPQSGKERTMGDGGVEVKVEGGVTIIKEKIGGKIAIVPQGTVVNIKQY